MSSGVLRVASARESKPVALVVGGGTGIGRACARRLAGRDVSVMLMGRRESKLKEAAAEIGRDYPDSRVAWRSADAGVAPEAEAAVAETVDRSTSERTSGLRDRLWRYVQAG